MIIIQSASDNHKKPFIKKEVIVLALASMSFAKNKNMSTIKQILSFNDIIGC